VVRVVVAVGAGEDEDAELHAASVALRVVGDGAGIGHYSPLPM